jgi:methyl-accepting chemotaxis protein
MKLRKLGLKLNIGIGFGSLLAIIAVMGMLGYRSAVLNSKIAQDVQVYSSMKDITRAMQESILLQRIGARDVMMGRDNENTHLYEHGEADFNQAMNQLKPLISSKQDREHYAQVELTMTPFINRNRQIIARYRAGDTDGAIQQYKNYDGLVISNNLADAMADMMSGFERQRQGTLNQQIVSDAWTKSLMLGLALAGLVLGMAIAGFIARSIVKAIHKMLAMIESISCNNLTAYDMEVETADEMGNAARGLNKMKNSLREIILSIASTAENVSESSRGISMTASQSANSAENQKRQVQQIATAMQEMAATVRAVSEHSNTAAISANSAADGARAGGLIVEDMLERMRSISGSVRESASNIEYLGARSDEIGRIVSVIDEIATQTNLLALNAAIEAARAGDQGRGFAVVAGEVRRLAERTSTATNEIAAVIQNVQLMTADAVQKMRLGMAAVEQGVEVTTKAGESIQRIIKESDKVGNMVAQIASAATEQTSTTEQVNASMIQISQLVAEAADGAQLSAHSCEQLFNLAIGLRNMVDRFQVGQSNEHDGVISPPNADWLDVA